MERVLESGGVLEAVAVESVDVRVERCVLEAAVL